VSRPAPLLLVLVVLGCSSLDEGAGGVVGLEIRSPELLTIEVGETLPLTGVITGVSPGTGRVQAFAGLLASSLVQFTVIPRADTLIVTDSVLTVAPGVAASLPLVAQLQSFSPPGPLADRPVAYALTDPLDLSVVLPGGVLTDTVNTGTDGAVSSVTLNRVNLAQPDTAIVEVRAFRTRGAVVPGSGQRFIVIFQ
jgi:hypothetical protein